MKKVININFQGRVIPIEEAAYDILKQYVESLRRFFINEEGRDEIINDIEGRIAELFGEVLKKGSTCITDDDVNAIIKSMGRPEDFDDDEANVQSQLGGEKAKQSSSSTNTGTSSGFSNRGFTATTASGRFYRDENHKVVAGVCSGIAKYFGIDPLVVRIIFIICAFAGFGFGFVVYLVLWVAVPSTTSTVIGSVKKRLFRDPDSKLIAGVCSGLSNYFGVNLWIPRALFVIPFLSFVSRWSHWGAVDFPSFLTLTFSPGALLVYIILWLVLPEALTTSEKLEMKGEKVDLNSIKTTIQNDMEGFKDRAEKFGKEVGEKAQQFGKEFGERGKQFGYEASHIARRGGSGVGYVIGLLVKIFVYFIVGCVLFGVVVGLFSAGVALTGLLPIKDFVLADGWQNLFAWGTLILGIWVPVIGIITWIIRRLAKMRSNSRTIRFTFVSLWLLGVFCFVGLFASLRDSFRYHTNNITEEHVAIANPAVGKLEIKMAKTNWYRSHNNFLHFEPFESFDDDTVYVNNLHLKIVKSNNDSFQVIMAKLANGKSPAQANELASRIVYNIVQSDTTLIFDKGIRITPQDKFRNQAVFITVAVPVGKKIMVDDNVRWNNFNMHFGWDNDWEYSDNFYDDGEGFDGDVEYVMMKDGRLKRTHPRIEDNDNNDDNSNNENSDNNSGNTVKPNSGNAADSNVYHYSPNNPKPKAPAAKPTTPNKKDSLPNKQAQVTRRDVKTITAIPAIFIERFTI